MILRCIVCVFLMALSTRACDVSGCPTVCADEVNLFLPNATSMTLGQAVQCVNPGGTLYLWPAVIGHPRGYPGFFVAGQVSGCSSFNQTYQGSSGFVYVSVPMTIASKCTDLPVAMNMVLGGRTCPLVFIQSGAVTISGIAFVGGPCSPGTYVLSVFASAASSIVGVSFDNVLSAIPMPGANILQDACPFSNPTTLYTPALFAGSSLGIQQMTPFAIPPPNSTIAIPQDWTGAITGIVVPYDSFAVLSGDFYWSYPRPPRNGLVCSIPSAIPLPVSNWEINLLIFGMCLSGWMILLVLVCCGACNIVNFVGVVANRIEATEVHKLEREVEGLHAALGIRQEKEPDQATSGAEEFKDWMQIEAEGLKYQETWQEKNAKELHFD